MDREWERLQDKIDDAVERGVYWDSLPLRRWSATDPKHRVGEMRDHMPSFGIILLDVTDISQNNTLYTHLEATIARQVAEKFGGQTIENLMTRQLPDQRARQGAENATGN